MDLREDKSPLKVTVITPTIRPELLASVKEMIESQTIPVHQWLHDADPTASIGAKRNRLCAAATGDVIAHFDDDDWYSPRYIEHMVEMMGDHQLCKLSRYRAEDDQGHGGIVDLLDRSGPHLRLPGGETVDLGPERNPDPWAFGCSFLFRRSAWEGNPFPDLWWNEDGEWVARVDDKVHIADEASIFIKRCHAGCSSQTYIKL